METYRASIATSGGSWLESKIHNALLPMRPYTYHRFQYPKIGFMDLLNSFYLWRQVPDSAWWWGLSDWLYEFKGPFHIARLSSGKGYSTSGYPAYRNELVFAGNNAAPLALWEYGSLASSMERGIWRGVPGMSRAGRVGSHEGPGYFPLFAPLGWRPYNPSDRAFDYNVEGVWLGPAHGTREVRTTHPELMLSSYFFWDGRSDVWYAVHSPFRRQVRDFGQRWWGSLDSLWAEPTFPRICGRCSWAGRMVGMGSSGFTAPIHSSVIALAHGAMPYLHMRDTFFTPDPFTPDPDTIVFVDMVPYPGLVGCLARPPVSWFRLDSIKMPGTLWDKLVWFTYGTAYSSIAPFTYLFSPVRSLMGQGWNYPIWHHRRLPEAPRPGYVVVCS